MTYDFNRHASPPRADKCAGVPSPETVDTISRGLARLDEEILKAKNADLETRVAGLARAVKSEKDAKGRYIRALDRAKDALRKVRLNHPCDLHDLIAGDALEDIVAIEKGEQPKPSYPRHSNYCEAV